MCYYLDIWLILRYTRFLCFTQPVEISMLDNERSHLKDVVIRVIGVGGGGGNAVEHMLSEKIEGIEFICANTDAQALQKSSAEKVVQLGGEITKGLGAGADPEVGRQSALADREQLANLIQGTDMLFITAGMGGGTGTGAAPVVAEVARELGILTVAVVTKPFGFEGRKRMTLAQEGMDELAQYVDSLITIPNDKLLNILGKKVTLLHAFKTANNILYNAVQGISDLITRPGLINVDFADVRTVMSQMGMAMMGTGVAIDEDRARIAAEEAIASPLLEDVDITNASGVLVNITAGPDMSIGEFEEVGDVVKKFASEGATVVVGTVIDPEIKEQLRVTVVVTGLGQVAQKKGTTARSRLETAATGGARDYHRLNKPAVLRKQGSLRTASRLSKPAEQLGDEMDYLDLPAFLRRQE